jgi:hypothetical protein
MKNDSRWKECVQSKVLKPYRGPPPRGLTSAIRFRGDPRRKGIHSEGTNDLRLDAGRSPEAFDVASMRANPITRRASPRALHEQLYPTVALSAYRSRLLWTASAE